MTVRPALKFLNFVGTYLFDSAILFFLSFTGVRRDGTTLMIVHLERIGDFILWLPSARRLVEAYRKRGFRIVAVVCSDCVDLAHSIDGIDEVWPLRRHAFRVNPLYRAALLRRFWRCGADEALTPTYSRHPSLGDAVMRASGAPRRVAFMGDNTIANRVEKWFGDRSYTELLPNLTGQVLGVQVYETLLERLGIPFEPFDRHPLPRIPFHGTLPPRYYVLVPGASQCLRQWPVANFARLAEMIHGATGMVGVICGGAADGCLAREIAGQSGAPLLDLTGRTKLAELADVIARSELVVSNETAAIHVAAAMRKQAVCILGGGVFGRMVPYGTARLFAYAPPHAAHQPMPCYGCDWACRYVPLANASAPCITAVTVDQVWSHVVSLLPSTRTVGGAEVPLGHNAA